MKFIVGRRYWSDDKYEIYVVERFERTNLLRVEAGLGLPANYKIRKGFDGREYIIAKKRVYWSFP
jgi:hypothetical protein